MDFGGRIVTVSGSSGPRPHLRLRVTISERNAPSPPPVHDVVNVTARCLLAYSRKGLPEHSNAFIGFAGLERSLGTVAGNSGPSWDFIVDADHSLLHRVEAERKGRDVVMRLEIDAVAVTRKSGSDPTPIAVVSGQVSDEGRPNSCAIEIPKSRWLEILKEVGYGEFHMAEIPLPSIRKGKALDASLQHLQRAWEHFLNGSDREAMAACYDALEWIAKHLGNANSKPDQNVFSNILKGLGHIEKVTSVARVLSQCASLSHLGRHEHKPSVELEHRDAELAILLTHACIAYLSRTTPTIAGKSKAKKATAGAEEV